MPSEVIIIKSNNIAPWLQVTLFKGAATKQMKKTHSKNEKGKDIKKYIYRYKKTHTYIIYK